MASSLVRDLRQQSVFKCHLYGRPLSHYDDTKRTNEYEAHCYIGEPSAGALARFFDDIIHHQTYSDDLFSSIHSIYFHDFEFEEASTNAGCVFQNVIGTCTFMNCPNLRSLETTVMQFQHISSIRCIGCTSLSSLSSLAAIPRHVPLKNLFFQRCGLKTTAEDDWEGCMRAVAQTRRGRYDYGRYPRRRCLFSLTIAECDNLISLPSSIRHLNEKDADQVAITIHKNRKLRRLPYDIGKLGKLRKLVITDCPLIESIPWTIGRVDGSCEICMDYSMSSLRTIMEHAGAEVAEAFDDYDFECTIRDLEPYLQIQRRKFYHGMMYLAVHLYRARLRAIDRLYRPGGDGFRQCKEHFHLIRLENW